MKRVNKNSFAKVQSYMRKHRLVAGFGLLSVLIGFVGIASFAVPGALARIGLYSAKPVSEVAEKPAIVELKDNTDELARLKISQEAIDEGEPIKTADGKCSGDSIYNDDGNGHFSVASRLSDGSWRCITYNLKDLQNYQSDDGKNSVKVSTDSDGKRTTVTKSTDETGSTTTTTTVTNPDGSGYSSTDGGYGKMVIGPTNDGRQIYGYFDYSDNRYYTDVGRFQNCLITQNTYTYSDGNTYSDGTYRELSASEKTARAAEYDCSRLPKVQYERARYDLALLKKCLREGQSVDSFDSATCYRKAER